jgi:hypothetical protein
MSKFDRLRKQQQVLAGAIEAETAKGRKEALASVRGLCKQNGKTMREVKPYVLERKPLVSKDGAVAAKPSVDGKTATGAKR